MRSVSRSPWLAGPPLIAVAALSAIALVAFWPASNTQQAATVIASRQLSFVERPGDQMAIIDARNGLQAGEVRSTADGFVPGVMYGMEVARRRFGVDLDAPYKLTELSDGRVLLTDPPTHNEIDLESFGTANARQFAALLHSREIDAGRASASNAANEKEPGR